MRKYVLIIVLLVVSLTGCESSTLECELGEVLVDSICIDNLSIEYFDGVLYDLHYSNSEIDVYKLNELPLVYTDDIIEIGEYDGYSYYFSSGTYLNYYKIVKDGTVKNIQEAIESDWITLDDLVNTFPVIELTRERIVAECDNPRETYIDGLCQVYVDEELLSYIELVLETINKDNNLQDIPTINLLKSTDIESFNELKWTGNLEWMDMYNYYFTMLEEMVLNGYQQNTVVHVSDFVETVHGGWFLEGDDPLIVIYKNEDTLVSKFFYQRHDVDGNGDERTYNHYQNIDVQIIDDLVHLTRLDKTYFSHSENHNSFYYEEFHQNIGLIYGGFNESENGEPIGYANYWMFDEYEEGRAVTAYIGVYKGVFQDVWFTFQQERDGVITDDYITEDVEMLQSNLQTFYDKANTSYYLYTYQDYYDYFETIGLMIHEEDFGSGIIVTVTEELN